ncbi:MAG: hypothetical protein Q8R04_04170 [Nanoarchaeota archaeon]|nr:hypothetical protein [Nanoarchaeota archaeon]
MLLAKKSQAALEFLMTYGWAILIVLVVVGTLAYFGVLSPDRFLPLRCSFPSGISCLDFNYDVISDIPTLKFAIRNNLGWDTTGVSIFPYDTDPSSPQIGGIACGTAAGGASSLKNDDQSTYLVNCDSPLPKGKVRTNLVFTYTKTDTSLPHQIKGTLTFKVD